MLGARGLFPSSALYPLWKMRESSVLLYRISAWNPFTQAVEMIRFALYERANPEAIAFTLATLAVLLALAIHGYNPTRGLMRRRGA